MFLTKENFEDRQFTNPIDGTTRTFKGSKFPLKKLFFDGNIDQRFQFRHLTSLEDLQPLFAALKKEKPFFSLLTLLKKYIKASKEEREANKKYVRVSDKPLYKRFNKADSELLKICDELTENPDLHLPGIECPEALEFLTQEFTCIEEMFEEDSDEED